MDLLNLIINSRKDEKNLDICFLCFKRDNNCLNIYTVFEICLEYYNISLSLADMIKSLFPSEIFLFRMVCYNCSDLISELYVRITKRKTKIKLLDSIMKQLGRQISEPIQLSENKEKVILKVLISTEDMKNYGHSILNQYPYNNDSKEDPDEILNKCSDTENQNIVLTCPHCTETFEQTDLLNSHLKTHSKKRKRKHKYHYCTTCNYKTLCKSTLEAHINKKHLHVRPHTCPICPKSFFNKSNLTEHEKTHNNQRNEVCEVCGTAFFHKKNLMEHLRLHADIRPYECNICSKKFITSGRRSDHMKRSHMERSESCLFCNKKYSLKKELTRHINRVHLAPPKSSEDLFQGPSSTKF